jgi:hypothetical protein
VRAGCAAKRQLLQKKTQKKTAYIMPLMVIRWQRLMATVLSCGRFEIMLSTQLSVKA